MRRFTTITRSALIKCVNCLEYSNCYDTSCGEIDKAIEKLRQYENTDLIDATKLLEVWDDMSSRGRTEFDQVIMTFPRVCKGGGEKE